MVLESGIRDPEKTYSGSRGQKGTGSRIRNTVETIPDPGSRGLKGTGYRIRIRNTAETINCSTFTLYVTKFIPYTID
jgi:hypothetical protein